MERLGKEEFDHELWSIQRCYNALLFGNEVIEFIFHSCIKLY